MKTKLSVTSLILLGSSLNAAYLATPKHTINVYQQPLNNSKILTTKKANETITIDFCDKYNWCKIKDYSGYVKGFQLKKERTKKIDKKPTIKKEVVNTPTKNKDEIQNSNEFKVALDYFNKKDYQKSFKLFEKLLDKHPSNTLIEFYYGRSAFEIKNYEYAFTSYDRILINEPQNHRVRAELARTLMMIESYNEAKKEFNKILLSPIPVNVRKNIEKMLKIIESKEKKYIFNKVAILGFGWDDNINNGAGDQLDGIPTDSTSEKEDENFHAILVGNFIMPSKSHPNYAYEATAIGYFQEQSKYKESNIQLFSLSMGLAYMNKDLKNLTSITYDHIIYGGSQLLRNYTLGNNIKYKLDKSNTISFDVKLKKKNFIKLEDKDKNAKIQEFGFDYTLNLADTKSKFILGTTYSTERKTQGTRVDVDKDINKYKFSYNQGFFDDFDITLGVDQELTHHLDKENVLNTGVQLHRKTDKLTLSTKLNYKLNSTQSVDIEYKNIDTNSNIKMYDYRKQSVNLNYTIIF